MTDNKRGSLVAVGLALVSGGLLGAAMALLLAPKSGRQAREQVRGYARRAEENVHELADKAANTLDQALDTGHKFIKDKQAALSEAVEAGRVAMQGERERVSSSEKV
jgi:gas vesicle protein